MKIKDFIDKCCLALEVEPGTLNRDSSPDNVETWDSMGYLNLIAMIDKELGLSLSGDDLQKINTLGDLIDELKSRGVLE
ncbi:TPA: acyl carrier protein [Candidatus Poribacteria bacterium]|nr:acyl carrier protein [Candidatus Poribacteria bacterium]